MGLPILHDSGLSATMVATIMAEMAQERRYAYETIERHKLPIYTDLHPPVIIGTYSLLEQRARRWLSLSHLCKVCDMKDSPTSFARDYLELVYSPRLHRITSEQHRLFGHSVPMPLAAKPCQFRHGMYIDIKSAWYSIMQIVGWDVDYCPGKWLAIGRPPFDFPLIDHKVARNALVSVAYGTKLPIYNGMTIEQKPAYNRILNRGLYVLISDVLNAIATQCVEAGALYVNCDGYITPNVASAVRVLSVIKSWHLHCGIKAAGPGFIAGPGSYAVGRLISKRKIEPRQIGKIRRIDDINWLQSRFVKAAELREKEMQN